VILVGQATASTVVMAYVFTNHFLNPLQDDNDPIAASCSVEVPHWVDALHLHFSYHTEHHLFPSMNSAYAPELSKRLQELYPDRYNRLPIGEAWRRLWNAQPFASVSRKAQRPGSS
jgi:fatty acid desaturase